MVPWPQQKVMNIYLLFKLEPKHLQVCESLALKTHTHFTLAIHLKTQTTI